jgi:hypothetical protein
MMPVSSFFRVSTIAVAVRDSAGKLVLPETVAEHRYRMATGNAVVVWVIARPTAADTPGAGNPA